MEKKYEIVYRAMRAELALYDVLCASKDATPKLLRVSRRSCQSLSRRWRTLYPEAVERYGQRDVDAMMCRVNKDF